MDTPEPDFMMGLGFKDTMVISLSVIAFILALITFVFNVIQKKKDNKRGIRKELTDIIKELVEVNLSFAKLNIENQNVPLNRHLVDQRRAYNSRRRYLIEHGIFLISQIPNLVNDIDYIVLANGCLQTGFLGRAEEFWQTAVEKSSNNYTRGLNNRGFASYYWNVNNPKEARNKIEKAIELLSASDKDMYIEAKSDTYLQWAIAEHNENNPDKASALYHQSLTLAQQLKSNARRSFVINMISANDYLSGEQSDADASGDA